MILFVVQYPAVPFTHNQTRCVVSQKKVVVLPISCDPPDKRMEAAVYHLLNNQKTDLVIVCPFRINKPGAIKQTEAATMIAQCFGTLSYCSSHGTAMLFPEFLVLESETHPNNVFHVMEQIKNDWSQCSINLAAFSQDMIPLFGSNGPTYLAELCGELSQIVVLEHMSAVSDCHNKRYGRIESSLRQNHGNVVIEMVSVSCQSQQRIRSGLRKNDQQSLCSVPRTVLDFIITSGLYGTHVFRKCAYPCREDLKKARLVQVTQ